MSGEIFFSHKPKDVTKVTVELAYNRIVAASEIQGTDNPVMNSPKGLNVFEHLICIRCLYDSELLKAGVKP